MRTRVREHREVFLPLPFHRRAAAAPDLAHLFPLTTQPLHQAQGKSVTQCAGAAPECAALRATLFHCKRAAVDARSRIQGNKLDR